MRRVRLSFLAGAAGTLCACSQHPAEPPIAAAPLAYVTEYSCGDAAVVIGMRGDETVMRVGGADHVITPAESETGTKYAAAGAGKETSFWSDGARGLMTLEGEVYPECIPVDGAAAAAVQEPVGKVAPSDGTPEVWTARGHEPGWMLTLSDGAMTLVYDYGEKTHTAPIPKMTEIAGGRRYDEGPEGLSVTVLEKICSDAATGLAYPDTVTATLGDRTLQGCGGNPEMLLAGDAWRVVSVNGVDVPADIEVTMTFDPVENRVGGSTGCNSYGAEYSVGGEGITAGVAEATQMACGAPVMDVEQSFLDALRSVQTYTVSDARDELDLRGGGETRIVARR